MLEFWSKRIPCGAYYEPSFAAGSFIRISNAREVRSMAAVMAAMSEVLAKGVSFLYARTYIVAKYGQETWEKAVRVHAPGVEGDLGP
jgi:hypothetical protein